MRADGGVEAVVGDDEALDRVSGDEVFPDDLGHVFDCDAAVPDGFGIDDDRGSVFALLQASGLVNADTDGEACGLHRIFEAGVELAFAVVGAGRPRAARLAKISADKNVALEFRQSETPLVVGCSFNFTLVFHLPGWRRLALPPMLQDSLLSLKDDMVAFISGHGMRRVPAYVGEEVPTVLWEDDSNPDSWKDFVETAKAAGAAFLTMSEVVLEKEDLELLIEELQESNFPDEESPAIDEAQSLATHVGRVGYIQLAFAHQGIVFLHENTTEWYERYQQLLESLEDYGDIILEDEDADEES